MSKVRDCIIGFILGVIACGIITVCFPEKDMVPEVKRDTIIKTDTFISPKYYNSIVVRKDTVTLTLVKDGEVETRVDTVKVEVPIERKVYSDSSYYAVVSGYMPNLDSIFVTSKSVYETKREYIKVKNRWGLGLQAGVGYSTKAVSPYIGIGVQYNLYSW